MVTRRRVAAATLLILQGAALRLKDERDMVSGLTPAYTDIVDRAALFARLSPDEESFIKAMRGILAAYRPVIRAPAENVGRRAFLKGVENTNKDIRSQGLPLRGGVIEEGNLLEKISTLVDQSISRYPDTFWRHRQNLSQELVLGFAKGLARSVVPLARVEGELAAMVHHGVTHKAWETVGDERVRHSHALLHGISIPVGRTFPNGCRYPKDPKGPLKETINCRCRIRPAMR